jgi:hypothetical protein
MISGILEITACIIATTFGMIGAFYGVTVMSPYLVGASGLLVVIVVMYLSQLAEVMQKPDKINIIICKVLNKLIYVTIVAQVITAVLMVK